MIVTCQECSTSFQLDDARIPASGARVRCSRCKHAFFLPSPSASQSGAVHAVVEQVVEGKLGGVPAPTRDLAHASRVGRSGPAARSEPEEEDWQFSQEIRVAGDDDRDEVASEVGIPTQPRPDSFDLTGDFGRGFDPETLTREESPRPGSARTPRAAKAAPEGADPSSAAAGKVARAEPTRDESSFGTIDDFSSLIEDDEISIDLATEQTPPPPSGTPARPPMRRADAVGSPTEDLGDPESWDIVGGEGARRASSKVAALLRPGASRGSAQIATPSRSAGLDLFGDTELPPVHDDFEESGTRAGALWAGLGRVVGSCVTLVSVAVVFGLLIGPEWSRWVTAPQRVGIGPFVAETGRAGWLESSRSGLLLVFEGELRNTGTTPLQSIPLQLSLLDGAGQRLSNPPLEVGAPLDAVTLRESSPRELSARRVESIAVWLATPFAPGEVRRFIAVATVDDLPEAARRVALEPGRADAR